MITLSRRAWLQWVLLPLVAAVLAGVAVYAALAAQPDQWQARLTLLAQPADQVPTATAGFAEVVGLGLPVLNELVRSPSLVDQALSESGVADTTSTELEEATTVELVPSSGIARVAVTAATEADAIALVTAVAAEIQLRDVLAPNAVLVTVDERPTTTRVSPTTPYEIGAAAVAAAFVLVATLVTISVLRRILDRRRWIAEALRREGISPLVFAMDSDLIDRLKAMGAASGRRLAISSLTPRTRRIAQWLEAASSELVPAPDAAPLLVLVTTGPRRTIVERVVQTCVAADAETVVVILP